MIYAIEALKCEKERLQNQLEDLNSQKWKVGADITEREIRVLDLETAIATLMAA